MVWHSYQERQLDQSDNIVNSYIDSYIFWQLSFEKNTKVIQWEKGTLGNKWCWQNSIQFSSVAQSCPTLCDPMNHSTPGLPVHHQLLEFTQSHVHRVGDAIQPSHPLSSPSPPAPNASQHQGRFQWVNSLHQVAKVVEFQSQHHPKNTQDWSPLGWPGWISLQSKGLSRVVSNTTVQKHQFLSTQHSSQSHSHIHTGPLEKP